MRYKEQAEAGTSMPNEEARKQETRPSIYGNTFEYRAIKQIHLKKSVI